MFFKKSAAMPSRESAPPGRATALPTATTHFISDRPLKGPYPEGHEIAMFGLGCFWGAERKFWELGGGVWVTAVGYAGGLTPNPTYEETCSGKTGHNEVVRIVFDPDKISYETLLKVFFESHNPTQGMRQGNDVGTQYRSGVYTYGPNQQKLQRLRIAVCSMQTVTVQFQPRSSTLPSSTTRKTIINSTWLKYHTVTAASVARASAAL